MIELCPLCGRNVVEIKFIPNNFGCLCGTTSTGYMYYVSFDDVGNRTFESAKLSKDYYVVLEHGLTHFKLYRITPGDSRLVMNNIPNTITIDYKLLDRLLSLIAFS